MNYALLNLIKKETPRYFVASREHGRPDVEHLLSLGLVACHPVPGAHWSFGGRILTITGRGLDALRLPGGAR